LIIVSTTRGANTKIRLNFVRVVVEFEEVKIDKLVSDVFTKFLSRL